MADDCWTTYTGSTIDGRHRSLAEAYGPFLSEAVAPFKVRVVIASKFGFELPNGPRGGRNCRPEHIRCMTEDSLRRFRVEEIDLYNLHRVDSNVPVEDIAGTVSVSLIFW